MKYNLKNRPQIFRLEGRYVTDLKKMKEWFEGFEAELRQRLSELSNSKPFGLAEWIKVTSQMIVLKEILGEGSSDDKSFLGGLLTISKKEASEE